MNSENIPTLHRLPTKYDFWFLPLGGTGEIGMNMNLYGHSGQWLMVDCGMGFDHTDNIEKRVAADPQFILEHHNTLQAIVITHAHEDHLGAIVEFWPRLQVPVYVTPFAAALLENKLSQVTWGHSVPIHIVEMQLPYFVGEFEITWLPIPHSIPEAASLLIETDAAKILHTGDWKIDTNPVIGKGFNPDLYRLLADYPINAMICDSTNAVKKGKTISESACYSDLYQTVKNCQNRVIVTCFSSNIARLITLAKIAQKLKRKMAVFGRSMETMVSIARRLQYWPDDLELIDPSHIGYLPRDEVMVVATGSQAEPRAALKKLANNFHRFLYLEPEDTVIFSAMKIPPNRIRIDQLIEQLRQQKIEVIHADEVKDRLLLHASGHPSQDDLLQLFQLIQPEMLIPTHGEPEHLRALTELAEKSGIKDVIQGRNGDLFKIAPFRKLEPNRVETKTIELSLNN